MDCPIQAIPASSIPHCAANVDPCRAEYFRHFRAVLRILWTAVPSVASLIPVAFDRGDGLLSQVYVTTQRGENVLMRVTEKFELIDKVARELQARFTYSEIDAFLAEFKIPSPTNVTANSKWVYAKAALHGCPEELVIRISQELDIISAASGAIVPAPRNWQDTTLFRLFISHLAKDKDKATRTKECLQGYGIHSFVAHEDIHPTLEWQIEIERGLHNMDALLAIHTAGFQDSFWCQQEVGFALGRNVKTTSLEMGELPTGFISKHQALKRSRRSAEEIAELINGILTEEPRTKDRLSSAQASIAPPHSGFAMDDLDDDVPF